MRDQSLKRFAIWDWLMLVRSTPDAMAIVRRGPRRALQACAMRRTAAYDAFADALRHGDEPEDVISQRVYELGQDYRKRIKRWEANLERDYTRGEAPSEWVNFAGLVGDSMVTVGGGLLLALVVAAVLIATAWLWVTALAVWLVLIGGLFAARTILRGRLRSAMRERRCANCGESLRDVRPAISVDDLDGANAGPAECPQCGVTWPLLPPGIG